MARLDLDKGRGRSTAVGATHPGLGGFCSTGGDAGRQRTRRRPGRGGNVADSPGATEAEGDFLF